jgi:thioredoxin-related protein
MRLFTILAAGFLLFTSSGWETDLGKAKEKATQEHKLILLNFSGSDWCGPCIRMHKDIFEQVSFTNYANDHLVLLNADFPRMAKNQLSAAQQKKNDKLADAYNSKGIFPVTLLLDTNGKVLMTWEGLPRVTAEQFTEEVKKAADAYASN